MRCSLCSYRSILHGTPQSMLHPNFWFLATLPDFADSLGPSPTWGGGLWHKALVVGSISLWRRLLASRP